jgi:hypothetical protein
MTQRWDESFGQRLRWAALLQPLLMRRVTREFMLTLACRVDGIWREFFKKTR